MSNLLLFDVYNRRYTYLNMCRCRYMYIVHIINIDLFAYNQCYKTLLCDVVKVGKHARLST